MAESTEHQDPLVDHLERLAAREDRATLARLRRTLQREHALDGLSVVLPFIPRTSKRLDQDENDALLVSGLFALHPESGAMTLPGALRVVAHTSDSVELRFRAMLGASREDLPTHLRHAVSLVAGHGIAIDWRDLHAAVRWWNHPRDRVRRRWARAFWTPAESSKTADNPRDERTAL
jgi:CRISPR system Cascade subunit CasB